MKDINAKMKDGQDTVQSSLEIMLTLGHENIDYGFEKEIYYFLLVAYIRCVVL